LNVVFCIIVIDLFFLEREKGEQGFQRMQKIGRIEITPLLWVIGVGPPPEVFMPHSIVQDFQSIGSITIVHSIEYALGRTAFDNEFFHSSTPLGGKQ
jgi:hypothetical protein